MGGGGGMGGSMVLVPSLAHPCPSFCVQLGREVVAGLCDVDAGVAFVPLLPGVGPGRPPSAPPLLLDDDLECGVRGSSPGDVSALTVRDLLVRTSRTTRQERASLLDRAEVSVLLLLVQWSL